MCGALLLRWAARRYTKPLRHCNRLPRARLQTALPCWLPLAIAGEPVKPLTDTTVMTRVEVAAWLKVKPRQVDRLGVPCIPLGRKTVRYLRADVVAWLEQQRKAS